MVVIYLIYIIDVGEVNEGILLVVTIGTGLVVRIGGKVCLVVVFYTLMDKNTFVQHH